MLCDKDLTGRSNGFDHEEGTTAQRMGRKWVLPWNLQRGMQSLDLRTYDLPKCKIINLVILRHHICDNLLQQLWKTNTVTFQEQGQGKGVEGSPGRILLLFSVCYMYHRPHHTPTANNT